MSALDRLLCERLGIEAEHWTLDGRRMPSLELCQTWQKQFAECGWKIEGVYPALSTTGDGMVLLMEALRAKTGQNCRVGTEANGKCRAIVFPNAPTFLERFNALSSGAADTAPMALALAAAAALGVEVPE